MEYETKKRWSRRRRVVTTLGIGVGILALIAGGGVVAVKHWLSTEFAPIEGSPELGKWYGIYPDGATDAAGDPYHGLLRLGASNKVMVVFMGGGVSVDDYTEARPSTADGDNGFYSVRHGFDNLAKLGLADGKDDNPFRDWTVIHLPYSTGDFHVGAGTHEVTGADGKRQTVHHDGFTNFNLVMKKVMPYLHKKTSELLVAGSSAGGFGAAAMTDQAMSYFPHTANVTTVADGALLLYDWKSVSTKIWKSPPVISDALTTNNFTLDSLIALKAKHPEVKVLFVSSLRDKLLTEMQAYLDGDKREATRAGGAKFQSDLENMVQQLQERIPGAGVYIYEGKTEKETGLTQHTVLFTNVHDQLVDGTTPLTWMQDAVNGRVKSYGRELLR